MLKLPPGTIYNPNFFNPKDLDDAKRIVLGYGIKETESKWETETAWTINLLKSNNFIRSDSVVLDWGCGIGRLSKEIIDKFGCTVIGVDINSKMLEYAKDNVNSEKFIPLTVDEYRVSNLTISEAIAVWAVQHSIDPDSDIDLIKKNMTEDSKLFVFEEREPTLPIEGEKPWFILRQSNFIRFDKKFKLLEHGIFPKAYNIVENNKAWWGFFKNK